MKNLKLFILFFLISLLTSNFIVKAESTTTTTTTTTTADPLIISVNTYYDYFDTTDTIQIWDTVSYPVGDNTTSGDPLWTGLENLMQHIQNTFQTDVNVETDDHGNTIKDGNGNPIPLPLNEQSELYQLNQSAGSGVPFQCSDDLYDIIKIGIQFAQETNGKLDPAIGPLVNLWDINSHAGDEYPIPSDTAIKNLLPLVNYQLVQLDDTNKTVLLPDAGMVLNLGAISKGYAADKIYEYLSSKNIQHAIINLGGNMYALGQRYATRDNGSSDWVIGIRDPRTTAASNAYFGTLSLIDKTVVTSGFYERYIIDPITKKLYSHILNPDTGYSVDNNLASVSVITDNSARADALSTSLYALGLDAGMQFIENTPNVEAVFVTKDNKVYLTSGVQNLYNFQITNSDFTLSTNQTVNNNPVKNDRTMIILISLGIVVIVGGGILSATIIFRKLVNKNL